MHPIASLSIANFSELSIYGFIVSKLVVIDSGSFDQRSNLTAGFSDFIPQNPVSESSFLNEYIEPEPVKSKIPKVVRRNLLKNDLLGFVLGILIEVSLRFSDSMIISLGISVSIASTISITGLTSLSSFLSRIFRKQFHHLLIYR